MPMVLVGSMFFDHILVVYLVQDLCLRTSWCELATVSMDVFSLFPILVGSCDVR